MIMKKTLLLILSLLTFGITQAQITAPAVEEKADTDVKYLAGAIQEVDGKVEINRTIDLPAGMTNTEALSIIDQWLNRCVKDARVRREIRLPQPSDNAISHSFMMEITFSQSFLSHDWVDFNFVLTMTVADGKVGMKMQRLRYDYTENGKVTHYSGEELVSDKYALNKKKTKIFPSYKKFRIQTINLLDELQVSLEKEFVR